MKRFASLAAMAAALAVGTASAFGQNPQGQSAPSQAQQPTDATQSAPSGNREFINDLTIAGMTEVQLGKLAMERASNPDVKAFGETMVKDHTEAGNELKQVASKLNVEVPTQLDQKHQDLAHRLNGLKGAEFDTAYMDAMVKGHQEVVAKLKARAGSRLTSGAPAAGDPSTAQAPSSTQANAGRAPSTPEPVGTAGAGAGDQELSAWAAKTLPVTEQHLARAQEIQRKLK
jgi:putative membrane protein